MALRIHFDGGSRGNPGPAAAGVIITDDRNRSLLEVGYFLGHTTNNQAEYKGLLLALHAAERAGHARIAIFCDSELVTRQILGQYRVKSPDLKPLFREATQLLDRFESWSINHVKRHLNADADALVNLAMDAGTDVVKLDLLGSASRAKPKPKSKPKPKPVAAPGPVQVTIIKGPNAGACPAECQEGDTFQFIETVPEDLCIGACAAVIQAVIALGDGSTVGKPENKTFTCPRKGCGTQLVVKRIN